MNGLEKILGIIDADTKQNEAAIIGAAEKKAAAIIESGNRSGQQAYEKEFGKLKASAELEYRTACSSAETASKRDILAFRSECIEKAVERAAEKLDILPDEEYFSLLIGLIGRYRRGGSGELQLGQRDLDRLPSDFEQRLAELSDKDSVITLSREAVSIRSGFVLKYGNISENCSFDSILEAERDDVRDTAASILFA